MTQESLVELRLDDECLRLIKACDVGRSESVMNSNEVWKVRVLLICHNFTTQISQL